MGLGVGCKPPPPSFGSLYHIGVVIAERFASHPYLEQQRYIDSFDNISRVKDHIKWMVAKGDLVNQTPPKEIVKKVKLVYKVNPNGKKTGRVRVVLSMHDGKNDDIFREGSNDDQETVQLDYDLSLIPVPGTDRMSCYETITDAMTHKT
ncbi:hypothetical protein F5Y03DRAFT_405610 [Xylaria venustula]|nr:hypothetical protein F5Y03DRAFT_405610 [Xylaria venustula]